jgi:hypothetical protein
MTIKYAKWPKNTHNGYEIYRQFPFGGLQKFTRNVIFGLKIYVPSGNPGFESVLVG